MTSPSASALESTIAAFAVAIDQCIALGEFAAGRQLVGEGLALAPSHPAILIRRARLLAIDADFAAAADDLRSAVRSEPTNARAWFDLGRAAARLRGWPEAVAAFETSLKLAGPRVEVLADLAHARANGGDRPGAITVFRAALDLKPDQPALWNDLGGQLMAVERYDEASAAFRAAAAPANLAVAEAWRGDVDASIAAHRTRHDAAGRQALGASLLSFGRLGEGWPVYRNRLSNPAHRGWHRGIPKPLFAGDSLSGQKLLIWSDQGLGDQILTAGLLREAAAAAANIVFGCEPRLLSLMQRSFPDIRCVPITDIHLGSVDLSDVEAHASISEIGAILRPGMASFPRHAGYLRADPSRVSELKSRYRSLPGQGPIVGISWRSVHDLAGADKSIALTDWRPILSIPGVRFVSLQYGAVPEVTSNVFVDSTVDAVADIDGFAAQVAAMDQVVSVSNTTVHMAGALGIPTLCLTPKVEGRPWYWFAGQDISSWYPTVRHVWQTRRRQWDDVIERAARMFTVSH